MNTNSKLKDSRIFFLSVHLISFLLNTKYISTKILTTFIFLGQYPIHFLDGKRKYFSFFSCSISIAVFAGFIKTNEWQTPFYFFIERVASKTRLQPKSEMDSSFLCWSWCQTYGSISPGIHGVPNICIKL